MKNLVRHGLLGFLLVGFAVTVPAADPPHGSVQGLTVECDTCHQTHSAPGTELTASAGNVNLCQSCHYSGGSASAFPVNSSNKAVPGAQGFQHGFDVAAVNSTCGAATPANADMAVRVMGGNVVCSTCHDQHDGSSSHGGTFQVSAPVQLSGSAKSLTVGGSYADTGSAWYLVNITQAGTPSTAKFQVSKDNGISWYPEQTAGAGTASGDGMGLTLTFGTGAYAAGDRWRFYAAWPFLRASMDSGTGAAGTKFCRDCHAGWAMAFSDVETYTGTLKSHPTGVALNANSMGYDRAVPLDGNGAVQGTGGADANGYNDLTLDSGGLVQCTTCHAVHYGYSNTSLTGQP